MDNKCTENVKIYQDGRKDVARYDVTGYGQFFAKKYKEDDWGPDKCIEQAHEELKACREALKKPEIIARIDKFNAKKEAEKKAEEARKPQVVVSKN